MYDFIVDWNRIKCQKESKIEGTREQTRFACSVFLKRQSLSFMHVVYIIAAARFELVLAGDPHENVSSVDPLALMSCDCPFWVLTQCWRGIILHRYETDSTPVMRHVFRAWYMVIKARQTWRHPRGAHQLQGNFTCFQKSNLLSVCCGLHCSQTGTWSCDSGLFLDTHDPSRAKVIKDKRERQEAYWKMIYFFSYCGIVCFFVVRGEWGKQMKQEKEDKE